jgi:hypothetical protein
MLAGAFFTHWFQYFYVPGHGPWYGGAVWGNLFVVPIAVLLGSLLWPPTRRRLHRFVDRKLAPMHEHIKRAEQHNEWMARHLAVQHKKITGRDVDPHPHFDLDSKP